MAAEIIEERLGMLAVMHKTLMLIIFIQDLALIAIKWPMEATPQMIIYYTKKSFLTAVIVQCRLSLKQAMGLLLRILFVIQIETAETAA